MVQVYEPKKLLERVQLNPFAPSSGVSFGIEGCWSLQTHRCVFSHAPNAEVMRSRPADLFLPITNHERISAV
jgi:hypothetical protein